MQVYAADVMCAIIMPSKCAPSGARAGTPDRAWALRSSVSTMGLMAPAGSGRRLNSSSRTALAPHRRANRLYHLGHVSQRMSTSLAEVQISASMARSSASLDAAMMSARHVSKPEWPWV